jgi:hypothetical protein
MCPTMDTQLEKLHLHLDTKCLNPKHIDPTTVPRKCQTEWLQNHQSPFPSYTICPTTIPDHFHIPVTIWQQVLYNIISNFISLGLYSIYTYIPASFIPWNIFKSAWLLNNVTIHIIIIIIIIPVCQQKYCITNTVSQVTLVKLSLWSRHTASLHT